MIKLTAKQLRNLIESVSRKVSNLNEANEDSIDVSGEVAGFVISALVMWLDEGGIDLIGSNAFEQMMGTLGEEAPVPARIEDVEHFAESAASHVLADPNIKKQVTQICKMLLESSY